jgi:hypothetical protein
MKSAYLEENTDSLDSSFFSYDPYINYANCGTNQSTDKHIGPMVFVVAHTGIGYKCGTSEK